MGYFFFIPYVLSPGTAERCTFESPHERIPSVCNVDANTFCRQHLKLVFNSNNKKKKNYIKRVPMSIILNIKVQRGGK